MVHANGLEARRGECRHNSEYGSSQKRRQVVVDFRRAQRRNEGNQNHAQPHDERANLDIAEEMLDMALPYLAMQGEVDRAQKNEHHNDNLERRAMVIDNARRHRSHAARIERSNGKPKAVKERAHGRHANEEARHCGQNRANDDGRHRESHDEASRLHNVGNNVLASALRRIQRRINRTPEQAQRQSDNDNALAANALHGEAPRIIGDRHMVDILHQRTARRGPRAHSLEHRIEHAAIMARHI